MYCLAGWGCDVAIWRCSHGRETRFGRARSGGAPWSRVLRFEDLFPRPALQIQSMIVHECLRHIRLSYFSVVMMCNYASCHSLMFTIWLCYIALGYPWFDMFLPCQVAWRQTPQFLRQGSFSLELGKLSIAPRGLFEAKSWGAAWDKTSQFFQWYPVLLSPIEKYSIPHWCIKYGKDMARFRYVSVIALHCTTTSQCLRIPLANFGDLVRELISPAEVYVYLQCPRSWFLSHGCMRLYAQRC